jgi:hypothetical protein
MTYYRYFVQVGDQYTYRDGSYELDSLVQGLLDNGIEYEGRLAEVSRLLRKAKGEDVPDPPKLQPVAPEKIKITVEKVPPPRPPKKEKWHKVGE